MRPNKKGFIMQMIAVKASKHNHQLILTKSPIDPRDLDAVIEDSENSRSAPHYFVPQHDEAKELTSNSWMLVPRVTLEEYFDFDESTIDTRFTEITRK